MNKKKFKKECDQAIKKINELGVGEFVLVSEGLFDYYAIEFVPDEE